MAGEGSRFSKAGFTFPKPLIEVHQKPMIQLIVENLGLKGSYIFIVKKIWAVISKTMKRIIISFLIFLKNFVSISSPSKEACNIKNIHDKTPK